MVAEQLELDSLLVKKGTVIFREGEYGYCAYIVERGQVEISVQRAGEKVILDRHGPGEIFGEMAIIDDKPRTATVTAVEDCDLLLITREQLVRRIEETDPILRMCLSVILDRFRMTMMRLQVINTEVAPPSLAERSEVAEADPPAYDHAIQEIRLERELEKAIHQEDFELHFQPIIELKSGSIAGFESLVRWRHSKRGLISPMVFIPTAESSGLIVPLGRWCFRQACEVLPHLQSSQSAADRASRKMFVSVNVSGRDFSDPNFVRYIQESLEETGVDPKCVKLEITESLLMRQPDRAIAALHECKIKGLSIAIDDFGTGYSSLSYLHKFPIDTLKIDRSFVQSMHDDSPSKEIIRSILSLASQLNIPVVAEGIETEEDARALRELDCAFGQGYLFAKPLPRPDAQELVRRWQAARYRAQDFQEAV